MNTFLVRSFLYFVCGVVIKCVFSMEVGTFSHALLTVLLAHGIFKLLNERNKG